MKEQEQQNLVADINSYLTTAEARRSDLWAYNAAIGTKLHIIKESFDGSTKQFGNYLAQHCPKLDVKLVSYYIKLAGYNTEQYEASAIIKWLENNAVNATNPRTCWDKFNKAHKPEVNKDEENSEVTTEAPPQSTKDSLVARLAQLYDEFTKRAVDLDEDDLDTISTIAGQFNEYVSTIVS